MNGVGLAAAFLGGLLALLSPCSALLLPAFFAIFSDTRGGYEVGWMTATAVGCGDHEPTAGNLACTE
jgi:cytochrome c biogenesis protein CcdA